MDKQPEALLLAEDFADWQAAKGKDHPATQEAHQKLSHELHRLYAENQKLVELSLEEAKINGAGAERELRLMTELDEAKRINLRDAAELRQLRESLMEQREAYNLYTTVSIEMRTKDEALLRRALTYLEYASQQLPMIHASIVDPVIDELKERLK